MSDLSLNAWGDELGLPGMGDHNGVLNPHDEPILDVPDPYPETTPPDLETELGQLEDNSASMEDTANLLAEIIKQGGMSQSYAEEAQRLIPDFCDAAPLGYFSKAPTATMYKVALEELSLGLAGLIAAGVAMLATLVVKLLKWMFGGDSDKPPKDMAKAVEQEVKTEEAGNDAVATAIKNTGSALQAVETDVSHGVELETKGGQKVKVNTIEDMFKKIVDQSPAAKNAAEFLKKPDPIFVDFIEHGEFSKHIEGMAGLFDSFNTQVTVRIKQIEDVLASINPNGSASQMPVVRMQLNSAIKPVIIHYRGKEMSAKEMVASIRQSVAALSSRGTGELRMSYADVFMKTAEAMNRGALRKIRNEYAMYAKLLATMDEKLTELSRVLGTAETDDAPEAPPSEIAKPAREAKAALQEDVTSMGAILHQMATYRDRVNKSSEKVITLSHYCFSALEAGYRAAGIRHDDLPESVRHFRDITKEAKKQVVKRNRALREAKR